MSHACAELIDHISSVAHIVTIWTTNGIMALDKGSRFSWIRGSCRATASDVAVVRADAVGWARLAIIWVVRRIAVTLATVRAIIAVYAALVIAGGAPCACRRGAIVAVAIAIRRVACPSVRDAGPVHCFKVRGHFFARREDVRPQRGGLRVDQVRLEPPTDVRL